MKSNLIDKRNEGRRKRKQRKKNRQKQKFEIDMLERSYAHMHARTHGLGYRSRLSMCVCKHADRLLFGMQWTALAQVGFCCFCLFACLFCFGLVLVSFVLFCFFVCFFFFCAFFGGFCLFGFFVLQHDISGPCRILSFR